MRGTVLFWQEKPDGKRGFGFIAPQGSHNRMNENVWFGLKESGGEKLKSYDRVEYTLVEGDHFTKGPRAKKVWLTNDSSRDEVTTLHGCDEVY